MYSAFYERQQVLYRQMHEQSIDMVIMTSPIHVYYFTGFYSDPHERFMALVFDSNKGEDTLYVPTLDAEKADQAAQVSEVIPVSDTEDPYRMLKDRFPMGIRTLGVEKTILNLYQAEMIQQIFTQVKFIDIGPFVESLRLKKSVEDIYIVTRAVETVESVLKHGVKHVKAGITELDVVAELEYQMKVIGADRPAFSTTVLSGPQSALPHGQPGKREIREGDFLLFDLGVFIDGYCSDITRTFIVGEASDEQKKMYNAVLQANLMAIQAVQAGEPIRIVDQAARQYIDSEGYGEFFIHRVGHGLGLEIHEAPSIHSNNHTVMEPGMLFTVEPGIYIPGIGGVRIEDDIYIGDNGKAQVLTTYPKSLMSIEI